MSGHLPGRAPGASAYGAGCRCAECTELHRQRVAAVRADLAARPREDVPHGTSGGYSNWSCRCEPCTEAHTAELAAYRSARKAGTA